MSGRRAPPLLVALFALAALARFWGLGREGLWTDEILTVLMSRGSFQDVLAAVRQDVHPPLHFLLCRAWQPVAGRSEWLWRLPSAVCGVAAVGATWRVGRRLLSPRAALLAALLGATSTMAIYFSQEARSYSLLVLLSIVALDRLLAWETSRRRRDAVLLGIVATLLLYTHYFGALVLLVFGAWIAARLARRDATATGPDGRGLRACGAALAAAAAAFLPWLVAVLARPSQIRQEFWMPAPAADWLPLTFAMFAGLARPPWGGSWMTLADFGIGIAVTLPVALALGVGSSRRDRGLASALSRPPAEGTWSLLVGWLVGPALIAYVVSLGRYHLYSHRNLIVSLPAAWLVGAALIDRIRRPLPRALAAGLAFAPVVSGALWYHGTLHREQWRELSAAVSAELRPEDAVSVEQAWLRPIFRYGVPDRNYREVDAPSPASLRGVRRLWLVRGPSYWPDHVASVNRELAALQLSGFRVLSIRRFIGADLVLLERTDGARGGSGE